MLEELLQGANVVVNNLGPGAADRIGLDAKSVARRHPKLISCTISGYGGDGPWADRKAYDLLIQAETGLVSLTGSSDEPAKVGISIADIAAGMYAYSGILTALFRRATTGRVSPVTVSLFDALAEWLAQPAYYARYGGQPPARMGADHATITPYGPFTEGDGHVVVLAVQNDREWRLFCDVVLGEPAIADDPRFATNTERVTHRVALHALIAKRMAELDLDSALALLEQASVATSRLNSVAALADHPALAGRDRWRTVGTPNGEISALLPPASIAGVTPVMGAVPAVGEHTDAILRELGRTEAQISALREQGIV